MKSCVMIGLLVSIFPGFLLAQNNETPYINVSVENDLFVFKGDATDRYYTNGVRIDYFFQKQKRKFPSSLLLKISDDRNVYGWGLAQDMFTPSRIDVPTVQYNDRPYAGALFAIHSLSSYDYSKKIKVTSELYLGVMGPLSLAEETQIWVHSVFNYTKPEGWKNQIPNDIIINYNLQLEKEMVYVPEKLFVTSTIETFTGTLYNAMGAGFIVRLGRVNNFFEQKPGNALVKKKAQVYVFLKPTVRAIYYNALLQGGIITNIKKSQEGYILNKDQIERINVFTEAGIVYERPKINFMLKQKMRTAPIKGGNALEVGNLSIGFKL